ncbi:MAG: CrcB family protein [Actinomycetaceae bacterium]|nr:CrcB family protein [Actinomycetaceae bacterium]
MWINVLVVFTGGALGVALRALAGGFMVNSTGLPVGTFTINVLGSFLLGFMTAVFTRWPLTSATVQRWKLFLGTGILGGFTTYSALAVDSLILVVMPHPILAVVYPILSVVLGVAAAWIGLMLGGRCTRSQSERVDSGHSGPATQLPEHQSPTDAGRRRGDTQLSERMQG